MPRHCEFTGCRTRPCFNIPEETKGIFCYYHKQDGMVNVQRKRCIDITCNRYAYYSLPGRTAEFCFDHKTEDMIDIVGQLCVASECNRYSYYNLPDNPPKFCALHKQEGMVDVRNKR